jgi:tetratricopeptide (TPR) repeat protein
VAIEPQQIMALIKAAAECEDRGEWREAADFYQEALSMAPLEAELWFRAGANLHRSGLTEESLQFLEKATLLSPENAIYQLEKGDALQGMRRLREAVVAYGHVLEIEPKNVTAYTNLGIALHEGGHPVESIANLECALEIAPDDPIVRLNYGTAHIKMGHVDTALEQFRMATALDPNYAEAWSNLGFALQEVREYDDAITSHRRALELNAENPGIHWNYSMTLLLLGDYSTGFSEYEYRRQMADKKPRTFASPEWVDQDLSGKSLLIHAEQGLGDTFQFARFLPNLAAMGAEVIVATHSALASLIAEVSGVSCVLAGSEAPPPHDLQLPLLSLPYRLSIQLEDLPGAVPYISAPPEPFHFESDQNLLKIGLVWAGNPSHANDRNRSCPFEELFPLIREHNANWYSLQVGPHAIAHQTSKLPIIDLVPFLSDFSRTAAAIEALDLIVTVDTAVAHLAGAMGKQVWILLPYAPDWRWMIDRRDSPWYPSATLFRQSEPGDWKHVIREVADQIAQMSKFTD